MIFGWHGHAFAWPWQLRAKTTVTQKRDRATRLGPRLV
jgi:hypothetical protein